MKKIITILFVAFTSVVFAQNYNGTYTNSAGQKLVISDYGEGAFQFTVTWGENDEWGCLFDANGTANTLHKTYAYYGEDADWPEIGFTFNDDGSVLIEPSSEWVGMDCQRYGESTFEKFTLFKKE